MYSKINPTARYEFGPYCVDVTKHILLEGEQPLQLSPKAIDLLLTLIEYRGQVLTRKRLIELVWPDSFVEENNLLVHMSMLRKTLRDNVNEPVYIATVRTRGYQFIASVRQVGGQNNEPDEVAVDSSECLEGEHEESNKV